MPGCGSRGLSWAPARGRGSKEPAAAAPTAVLAIPTYVWQPLASADPRATAPPPPPPPPSLGCVLLLSSSLEWADV